jgi:hypothetical protein
MGKGIIRLMLKIYSPKAATDVYTAKTIEDRRAAAGRCETTLEYGIQTYVDEMDNAVNRAYAAWPTRLYLIGLDGRVAYAGGLGPWGFKPKAFRKAIEKYLADMEHRNLSKASYQAAS